MLSVEMPMADQQLACKLQISCVVEDNKVGSDILSEKISEFENFVQSVDVASFNKV